MSSRVDCRERLRAVASESGGAEVAAMVGNAKLFRATLVLASGSSLGASPSALVHAAVAIELIHLASLVHDDIIDEATERRGVPALHVALGRDRALVVGDLLIVAAFEELGRVRCAAAAVATLSEGARLCCLGQLTELGRHMVSETDYLDVVAKKTGALFAVAASLGGLIAEAPDDEVAALAAFGTALGSAYQIRDDLHDGALFTPTHATYARARSAVLEALARVPASCDDALRALANEALGGFSQTETC